MLQIDERELGSAGIGDMRVLYADLPDLDFIPVNVRVGAREFAYQRSYPAKGYGAVMPAYIRELVEQGRTPLVVERNERYLIFIH